MVEAATVIENCSYANIYLPTHKCGNHYLGSLPLRKGIGNSKVESIFVTSNEIKKNDLPDCNFLH